MQHEAIPVKFAEETHERAPSQGDWQALPNVVRDGHRSFQVVALGAPSSKSAAILLLWGRAILDGRATTYVCGAPRNGRAFACQAPVTEPEGLRAQLQRG
jgi:hypothetical protein